MNRTRTQDLTDDMAEGIAWTAYLGWIIVFSFLVVLAIAAVEVKTHGWFYSQENLAVRHSIGYTTAHNQQCANDMQVYAAAEKAGDKEHMAADYNDCRLAVQGMSPDEIDPSITQFLATKKP